MVKLIVCAVTLACSLAVSFSFAQTYPIRAIRIVVPFPPGGESDVLARIVASSTSVRIGQPVVVYNQPGAGGIIAHDVVAKSPPDGYTLLLTSSFLLQNKAPDTNLPYNPDRDFIPIAGLAVVPLALVVSNNSPTSLQAPLARIAY